jgi:hypothetical protein
MNGQYGIPKINPFAEDKNALGEIYAYGFRNPHRFTWTRNGEMIAFNVGHANIESIDLIKPGHDYGWPIREGSFLINPYGDLKEFIHFRLMIVFIRSHIQLRNMIMMRARLFQEDMNIWEQHLHCSENFFLVIFQREDYFILTWLI